MTLEELVDKMDAEMYTVVKRALELSKWPDGTMLDAEQKKMCMQAIIIYEDRHMEKNERSGFLSGDDQCASEGEAVKDILSETPLKWH